jgi:hypothetical protein
MLMKWSDVTAPPHLKTLRQFAGLWMIFFGGLAAWRVGHGHVDVRAETLAVLAVGIGGLGLVRPAAMRWIYTGWMMAAFPIGWTVSSLMVAAMFYVVFAPVAWVFRLMGRDALRLRRGQAASYWIAKARPSGVNEYLRQS